MLLTRTKKALGILLTLLLALASVPAYGAGGSIPAEATQLIFIQFLSPAASEANDKNEAQYVKRLESEQAAFHSKAKTAKVNVKQRHSYSHLFNGIAAEVKVSDLPKIARMEGVKAIFPVVQVEAPVTQPGGEIDPDLATAIEMAGATQAHAAGYTGKGIVVAVIDTGIDYTHPDLGGCFGKGCRVVGGYDFVGDDGFGTSHWTPNPDPDPMDYQGHGTHVAGIVGAKGALTGVAPDVTFRAYKVFDQGSSTADVILAALEMAKRDKVHIVNMSLGAAYQWPQYPTATASDNLVRSGTVVIASAGNSGRQGLFSGGAPSLGEQVIAVASFENSHVEIAKGLLGDGTPFGYGVMTNSPSPVGLTGAIVALPASNHGCTLAQFSGYDLTGKIALISRGTCAFADKSNNAKAAGAIGAIIHNNAAGPFSGTLGTAVDPIPTVSISLEDGNLIRSKLPTSVTFTNEGFVALNPNGGLISDFSAWGLSPDLALKPDLGAPGGNIKSTYPLAKGGYATLSGTSMSAPHVAGLAALVLEARPKTRARDMADMLRNSATPVLWSKTAAFLLPTHRQGAGMANVMAAIEGNVRVTPSKLSLGEMDPGSAKSVTLLIRNEGKEPVTYTIGHLAGLATGPMASAANNSFSLLTTAGTVSTTTVTLPGRATREVTLTVTAPVTSTARLIFGGWITLTPQGGGRTLRVPYAGMAGDYQTVPILNRNAHGFPWLASLNEGYYNKVDTLTINPAQDQSAYILVNFAHQVQHLIIEAVSADATTTYLVWNQEYVGRHASPINDGNSFFSAYSWDGRDSMGNAVPDGAYTLVLKALKPLGDHANPAHWEVWTSGTVTVQNVE